MFTRPALYHPYKRSAPVSPAGFRIPDYLKPKRCFNLFQGPDFTNTRSPAPSPFSSPIKGQRHPADSPPTIRLADFIAGDGFGTPKHPFTPGPDHPRNAPPNVQNTNVPAQGPLPVPPRREGKRGPKHLSLSNPLRPGVPPRRRAQQLREKRDMVRRRILDRHERRLVRARERISDLRREAEALMRSQHMDRQDRIFLKQLKNLQLDQVLKHDLEECRQQMSRATNEAPARKQEHEKRDQEAEKMRGKAQGEEALEEQKRKVEEFARAKEEKRKACRRRMEEAALLADEERQRAHEALERKTREEQERLFREEQARKAKEDEERRRREEQERQLREERERILREEVERLRREAHEQFLREQQERSLRAEVERLRREAHEKFIREQQQRERRAREERERQARLLAEQIRRAAQDDQTRQQFVAYEGKWNELRSSNSLPPIDVQEMPWPVFGVVSSADQITYQDVQTFLFHPLRPDVEGKTSRDKVKLEVLRFHPDKFNTRVVPKIQPSQRAVAQEIAGAVARILTRIMTEQVEQQK
ncbi:hypothetical protein J3R83DRAFT_10536 [Lanmaoa asiatica]|nr:hypothetical protein J3R83DRAFT_10536 [Lanmaoa asiatica]